METGYSSDKGRKREQNEDSVLCIQLDASMDKLKECAGLFIVADGMGGHKAGETASRLAVSETARTCMAALPGLLNENSNAPATENPAKIIELAINMASKAIYDLSQKEKDMDGMGTTIVVALVAGQDLYVTNVGDSRCYIINENEIVQVSTDHSLAHEMVMAGLITAEESKTHPRKNVLTRVVGYDEKLTMESHNRKLYCGDNILLCSDGLWGVVPDQQIKETVLAAATPQEACDRLVATANDLGGPDNISVIIARPEALPDRKDVLEAETVVLSAGERSGLTSPKARKGFFSFLRRPKRPAKPE